MVTNRDIEAMIPRVRTLIRTRFANVPPHIDRDDLTQAAMEAICRHRHAYNPARGATWTTSATYRAIWAIQDYLRHEPDTAQLERLPDPGIEDPDPPDPHWHRVVELHVNRLPIRQARTLHMVADGYTQKQIADLDGVSETRISLILTAARNTLTERLAA